MGVAENPRDQLALEVEPTVELEIHERRDGGGHTLLLGPFTEPDARALAALLLNRHEPPPLDGPWRCAIAGGSRTVALVRPVG